MPAFFHRHLPAALVALALTGVTPLASATCTQLDGMALGELEGRLSPLAAVAKPDKTAQIDTLKSVYKRLSAVAGITPALLLCDDKILNATASGEPRRSVMTFYTPMLDFLEGNVDETAAVMGHELAHVLLNHMLQRQLAAEAIGRQAKRAAISQYRRTGSTQAAIDKAKQTFETEAARFSRAQEREADEKGFSLAVTLAKYSGEGAKSLAKKLSKLPASDRPPYLDTHPGWLERFDKADILSLNQQYADQAARLLRQENWTDLQDLTDGWLREIPASGAGWYYKGRALAHKSRNRSKISQTYEASLTHFLDNVTLGTRSQEDQAERDDAWYYLCLALFDEGFRFESAHCAKHIDNEGQRNAFQARAFGKLLLVGGEDIPAGNLLVARNSNGGKLLTNDLQVAASRGTYLPIAPSWKALRFPERQTH